MRILITGVYGFVGSYFARMAIDMGHEVVGFSRLSNMKNKDRINSIVENPNFTMIHGDLTNPNDTSELCEDIDVVVNFVSKTSQSIANITGTINLLESAKKYKPKLFIQISTDKVYGFTTEGLYDEYQTLNPNTTYAASKASSDMYCLSYFNEHQVPVIITRAENNYGPYQTPHKTNIPGWIKNSLNDKTINVFEHKKQSWLHVQDHCYAIFHIIKKGLLGEIYNIAGNENCYDVDIVNKILNMTNSKSKIVLQNKPDRNRWYGINSERLRMLGWKTQYSIDTSLKQTIEWYKLNEWWWFR